MQSWDSEWQWHRLGHMLVCTSLQTDNHASTPPLSFLQAGCPSCCPTNSVKALKAILISIQSSFNCMYMGMYVSLSQPDSWQKGHSSLYADSLMPISAWEQNKEHRQIRSRRCERYYLIQVRKVSKQKLTSHMTTLESSRLYRQSTALALRVHYSSKPKQ